MCGMVGFIDNIFLDINLIVSMVKEYYVRSNSFHSQNSHLFI